MDPLPDDIDFAAPYTPPTDEEYCKAVHFVLMVNKQSNLENALQLVPPHRREAVRQLIEGADNENQS